MIKKLVFLLICFIVFGLALPNIIYAQQDLVLNIKKVDHDNFPQIDLFFTLLDTNGARIKDLRKDNIALMEKGVEIKDLDLETIVNTQDPTYITLLFDTSGSMRGEPFIQAKNAAIVFLDSLKDVDEVKLITFDDEINVIENFTADKEALKKSVGDLEILGTKTALNMAAYQAAQDLSSKPLGQRIIVVLTDGKDEDVSIKEDDAINIAKENKIPIYSIGFGPNFLENTPGFDEDAFRALNRFSFLTGGIFLVAEEEKELTIAFSQISDLLRYQYKISYASELIKDGESHDIELMIDYSNKAIKEKIVIITPLLTFDISIPDIADHFEIVEKTLIRPQITVNEPFDPRDEIDKVIIYLNSEAFILSEASTYPYSFELDPSVLENGNHNLIIRVIDNTQKAHEIIKPININAVSGSANVFFYLLIGLLAVIIVAIIIVLYVKKKKRRTAEDFSQKNAKDYSGFSQQSKDLSTEKEGQMFTNGDETISEKIQGLEDTIIEGNESGFFDDEEDVGSKTIIRSIKDFEPSAWLVVTNGEQQGSEYAIPTQKSPDKRRFTIGRSEHNDIAINDDAISREHAFILIEGKDYKIGDMGSTNGSYVNDKKISAPKKLIDGDKIALGDTEIIFKYLDLSAGLNKNIKASPKKPDKKNKKTDKK